MDLQKTFICISLNFFSDQVDAVSDVWIVGDQSLKSWYATFLAMKSQAVNENKPLPYLNDSYNILPFYKPSDLKIPMLARLINTITEGLNEEVKLPRYIIIVTDRDVLDYLHFDDFGIVELLDDILNYTANEIITNVETRKEDLRSKRACALYSSGEPRYIWVKMITRPIIKNAGKYVFPHTQRYNEALERMVLKKKYSHILEPNVPENRSMFELNGELSIEGKIVLWNEINRLIKNLDKGETDLMPKEKKEQTKKAPNKPTNGRPVYQGTSKKEKPRPYEYQDQYSQENWTSNSRRATSHQLHFNKYDRNRNHYNYNY